MLPRTGPARRRHDGNQDETDSDSGLEGRDGDQAEAGAGWHRLTEVAVNISGMSLLTVGSLDKQPSTRWFKQPFQAFAFLERSGGLRKGLTQAAEYPS